MNTRYLSLIFLLFFIIGCENMNDLPSTPTGTLEISKYEVEMEGRSIDVVITSESEVSVTEKPDWIEETAKTTSKNKHIFTFLVNGNISLNAREGQIKFATKNISSIANISQTAYLAYTPSSNLAGLEEVINKMELETVQIKDTDGTLIDVKGKTSDPRNGKHANTNSPFSRLYDGTWSSGAIFYSHQYPKPTLPATVKLDFYLPANSNIFDHILYYPTYGNEMGAWGEIEVYASTNPESRETTNEDSFKKVGEMDCEFKWQTGQSIPISIPATTKVKGVRTVRILVKTAMSLKGNTICVSAHEVELYGQAPLNFQTTDLFSDNSCTALKAGIDANDIADYDYPMFQNLANYLYLGLYPQERILNVSEGTTPTSVRAPDGQSMVIMAESAENSKIEIDILSDITGNVVDTYLLTSGANVIKNSAAGRIQVRYVGSTAAKLNLLNGEVIKDN